MALIPCPECGKEISTSATTCPHCGLPNPSQVKKPGAEGAAKQPPPRREPEPEESQKKKNNIGCFTLVAVAIVLASMFNQKDKKTDTPATTQSTVTTSSSSVCTHDQKSHAMGVLAVLRQRGTREVVGSGAWYDWRENWYAMNFQRQMDTIRLIADTEYCASDGKITHMHVDFNGEHVAEATPNGGVRVLKSRP